MHCNILKHVNCIFILFWFLWCEFVCSWKMMALRNTHILFSDYQRWMHGFHQVSLQLPSCVPFKRQLWFACQWEALKKKKKKGNCIYLFIKKLNLLFSVRASKINSSFSTNCHSWLILSKTSYFIELLTKEQMQSNWSNSQMNYSLRFANRFNRLFENNHFVHE